MNIGFGYTVLKMCSLVKSRPYKAPLSQCQQKVSLNQCQQKGSCQPVPAKGFPQPMTTRLFHVHRCYQNFNEIVPCNFQSCSSQFDKNLYLEYVYFYIPCICKDCFLCSAKYFPAHLNNNNNTISGLCCLLSGTVKSRLLLLMQTRLALIMLCYMKIMLSDCLKFRGKG